jgi:AcrR family transcriptional regulator
VRAAKIKTEIRQEQIAAAALDLMARHGTRALSVARLAGKVGVVPSAIYRHYSGKDAVLDAVLDLISQRLQENVQAVRQETTDALERLHRLLERHVQLIRNNIAIPRVVFSEDILNGHAPRRRRVHRLIEGYLDQVAELIAEGQQAGNLRTDVSADTLSVMYLGMIHPAVILWLASDGAFDVSRHTAKAWPLFAQMLQPEPNQRAGPSRFAGRGSSARRERIIKLLFTKRFLRRRKFPQNRHFLTVNLGEDS